MKLLAVLLSLGCMACSALADAKTTRIHEIEATFDVTYCRDLNIQESKTSKPIEAWCFYCIGPYYYHKTLAFVVPQWPTDKQIRWAKAASAFCSGWYIGLDAYSRSLAPETGL